MCGKLKDGLFVARLATSARLIHTLTPPYSASRVWVSLCVYAGSLSRCTSRDIVLKEGLWKRHLAIIHNASQATFRRGGRCQDMLIMASSWSLILM